MEQKKTLKPLNITIDPKSAVPVYQQVKQGIKLLIVSDYLEAGDRLVPIRELAANLKINPNTIVKVYYQMDVEGYIYSLPGSGYFVAAERPQRPDEVGQLLAAITDDYLAKAVKLGLSVKDLIHYLESRTNKPACNDKGGKAKETTDL